jgi:diguanylate cyclase (GGDEF)-like protein/PAS domain S-box-containing protein
LDWVGLTHPDDVAEDLRLTETVLSGQSAGYRHVKRYVLEDGTVKWGDVSVVRIDDGSATPSGVVQVVDMTSEMTAREELERSERRLRALVDQASIPMSYGPVDNGLAHFNEARLEFHELTREELERADFRELIHPEDLTAMQPLQEAFLAGEIDHYRVQQRFVMPDGRVKWGDKTVARLDLEHDGDAVVVVQIVDVTPEVHARERLQHLVDTEPVTGLGSRSWITTELGHCLRESPGPGSVVALFVDLSEFGIVTRTLGYEAGDEVLANVARAIAGTVPDDYLVGRFWGDRILIVAPQVTRIEEVEATAARILRAVATEQVIDGSRISRTGNVGIAVSQHGSTVTSMLRSADEALAVAIATGRSRWHLVPDDPVEGDGVDSLRREHDLREALDERQFALHYQPQVRLADGEVCGYEALVRWQHPERGLLAPAEFMDLMESSGLIVDLGRQVLEMACADIVAAPQFSGPVSVNVSALEITEPDWLDHLTDTIRDSGVAADRLTIELTETTLLRLTPDAELALDSIRAMGMGLHIDDFGTGYASIGALQQVPLTGLKLDRTFVSALAEAGQADLDLVTSIASMAKGLRLEPIAEGIETPQEAALLQDAGWVYGQGYLYGKPAPKLHGGE